VAALGSLLYPVAGGAAADPAIPRGHDHSADLRAAAAIAESYRAVDGAPVDGLPDGWVMTDTGPLGPADRDLLVKVRLAGLWEVPAGDDANRRAVSDKVREVGRKIAAEHRDLDQQVRIIAADMSVALPNEPSTDQRTWLGEMAAARGAEFDRVFIDRLRNAHGKVFSVIAGVRAGTRNSAIRDFAAVSNAFVLRHMTYLESSGLVDFATLPLPPDPATAGSVRRTGLERGGGVDPLVIWLVLIAAGVAAIATTARVLRAR